jgi:hypothetical protein
MSKLQLQGQTEVTSHKDIFIKNLLKNRSYKSDQLILMGCGGVSLGSYLQRTNANPQMLINAILYTYLTPSNFNQEI